MDFASVYLGTGLLPEIYAFEYRISQVILSYAGE